MKFKGRQLDKLRQLKSVNQCEFRERSDSGLKVEKVKNDEVVNGNSILV
jgi:hypothetical protein